MDERARVGDTFARYRRSHRKQRAWRAQRPGNRAIRDELTERVLRLAGGDLRRGEVLDMGSGSGWWLGRLAAAGVPTARLHGIDLLPERVQATAARVPGVRVRPGDIRDTGYEDDRFSAVTLLLVLSSMDDGTAMRAALAEARRVVVPGGAVVVWEPRWPNPFNRSVHRVPVRLLDGELGPPSVALAITAAPPLARMLPTRRAYNRVASIPALRSHRLAVYRPGTAPRP